MSITNKKIKVFNTLGRELQEFIPKDGNKVGMYTCGPTVYNYAHIGNLRSYVFADLVVRSLKYFGFEVNQVMNITDVGHLTNDSDDGDDKMEVQANQTGETVWDIAEKYTKAFFGHTKELNIIDPNVVCKATDHIKEQIDQVKKLEENGYTYTTTDGVYFDSLKFERYADLAKLKLDGLKAGERVEMGEKKNPSDFSLWKFSPSNEKRAMEWESPWGKGFPGWHIECTAMSMKYLGDSFDLHTGGIDHIPIHHSNEIAQAECATGTSPFVKYWMHGEFLVLDKSDKMSKSAGNFLTLDTLKDEGYEALAYRYFLITSHYRSKLKFSFDNLKASTTAFKKLRESVIRLKSCVANIATYESLSEKGKSYIEKFECSLANDINMPEVVANMWDFMGDKSLQDSEKLFLVLKQDEIMGLDLKNVKEEICNAPAELMAKLDSRNQARSDKNWALADQLRDEILSAGYIIVDGKEGSSLKKQ